MLQQFEELDQWRPCPVGVDAGEIRIESARLAWWTFQLELACPPSLYKHQKVHRPILNRLTSLTKAAPAASAPPAPHNVNCLVGRREYHGPSPKL